jgi:dihydroneopterin aldolase
MGIVALRGIAIYSHIGVDEEERKLGRQFVVDVEADITIKQAAIDDDLSETLDYADINRAVQQHLNHPHKLLETAGRLIAKDITDKYKHIKQLKITIRKMRPFLNGEVGCSEVCFIYPEDYV